MPQIDVAFVQLAIQGLDTVRADLNKLKDQLRGTETVAADFGNLLKDKSAEAGKAVQDLGTRLDNMSDFAGGKTLTTAANAVNELDKAIARAGKGAGSNEALKQMLTVAKAEATSLMTELAKSSSPDALKSKLAEVAQVAKGITKEINNLSGNKADPFAGMMQSVGKLGQLGQTVFKGLASTFMATAALASPKGMDDLTFAFQRLAIQVGRIFMPILKDLTFFLNMLADKIKSLTNDQRDHVQHWLRWGFAIGGILMILPRVVSIISGVSAAFKALRVVMLAVGASNPFGWIALAIAGIVALFSLTGKKQEGGGTGGAETTAEGGGLSGLLATLTSALTPVIGMVVNAFNMALAILIPIFDALANMIGTVVSAFAPFVEAIVEIVNAVLVALKPAFDFLAAIIQTVVAVVGAIFGTLIGALRPVIDVIMSVLKPVLMVFGTILQFVGNVIIDVLNAIIRAVNSVLK
jgi:hypothetical protein